MNNYQEDYYIDDMYSDDEEDCLVSCPVCGGDGQLMGSLGRLNWYRCVNCGMEFNQERE